ncbi:P-loop containing nucleoside triphosphate hydrolase protein [Chiua virens]|nr:P-loop containing nucleoside triphosphate hydrolase protein [Chiua virens]
MKRPFSVSHDRPVKLQKTSGPLHDARFIDNLRLSIDRSPLKPSLVDNPKSPVANFAALAALPPLRYLFTDLFDPDSTQRIVRCSLHLDTDPQITAIGDHTDKKSAERLCALSALYQLHARGLLDKSAKLAVPPPTLPLQRTLSDGSVVSYERARSFMDYYLKHANPTWEAVMLVDGRRIGMGAAPAKKAAHIQCYLDVAHYLESCDPALWKRYLAAAKTGKDLGLAPKVALSITDALADDIIHLRSDIKKSLLYRNRPVTNRPSAPHPLPLRPSHPRYYPPHIADARSAELYNRRQAYLNDPSTEKMRSTRATLPIYTRSQQLLSHISEHDVTICMAATGSGKTTQVPQLILDDYINRGQGAHCNIVCTQPRRLAALSVADRVAKERGELVGRGSVGYSVRFESNLPEEHGSITFCTIGVLLRRLQSAMAEGGLVAAKLDQLTHILVDEVHERDIDTDLLLVVLKRLIEDRKARNLPLKVVLMSATIDPRLFQEYFPDNAGNKAQVIEIPGRTFPVVRHFMDDFLSDLKAQPQLDWVFNDESVSRYISREEAYTQLQHAPVPSFPSSSPQPPLADDELELPAPLVAAAVVHVFQKSDSGHVLIFLPGWEEISAVQRCLLNGGLGLDFGDQTKYSIHVLHSTIPLAEQQVIFDPPPEGVRRIILATNVAETSVTIPDVVYVVDTGKIKELRFDPRSPYLLARLSLGRHRPGEYFGLLSKTRVANLHPHQTVEMKRVDLSNTVMRIKALSFPGMEVEQVLASTIEPPAADRVEAAMKTLQMVSALDHQKKLTSLGRILLQLPVDIHIGRLVLYGVFFRCLDQALTLAAILTNRDPFFSPIHLKAEAAAVKATWSPREFRSDALTILNAFCADNFLSKSTLVLMTKVRGHLLQSLYQAGVIDVAEGSIYGRTRDREWTVPSALNVNARSQSLLAALVAVAAEPKFAVRTGEMTLRTQHDKATFIHPSSVNHRKHFRPSADNTYLLQGEKQIYAYAEKRQNLTVAGQTPQMYLINTTRLDPMTYLLFGANDIQATERGLECDEWLPIVGNLDVLDDIQHLKTMMEACMSRVFEGTHMGKTRLVGMTPREDETGEEAPDKDRSLSPRELSDLDSITRDIVRLLDCYSDERMSAQSATSSRNATPMASPAFSSSRLPGSRSGYSTPFGVGSAYNSRPGTPSRLSRSYYS